MLLSSSPLPLPLPLACLAFILSLGCSGADPSAESSTTAQTEAAPNSPPEVEAEPASPESQPRRPEFDLLHRVPTIVSATSAYRDQIGQVGRLYDGDLTTAWNSATQRSGRESTQRIFVRLPPRVSVYAIEMTVGYTREQRGNDLFVMNRRVSRVTVRSPRGQVSAELDPDDRSLQRIDVEGGGGDWEIELTDFVPGTRSSFRELVVSELRVMGEVQGAPNADQPQLWLGPLPPEDPSSFETTRAAIVGSLFPDETPPVLRTDQDVQLAVFEDAQAQIRVRLQPGNCYAVLGEVHRTRNGISREEPEQSNQSAADTNEEPAGETPAEAEEAHDPEPTQAQEASLDIDFGDFDDELMAPARRRTRFAVAAQDPFCPEQARTVTLTVSDPDGLTLMAIVYERHEPGSPGALAAAGGDGFDGDNYGEDGYDGDYGDDAEGTTIEPPSMGEADGLRVSEFALGPEIVSRRIEDPRQSFSRTADDRVYARFRLENAASAATTVRLAWEDDEGNSRRDPSVIEVPAQRRFVTYRYTNTSWRRPGFYNCVLRSSSGAELGRIRFEVTE